MLVLAIFCHVGVYAKPEVLLRIFKRVRILFSILSQSTSTQKNYHVNNKLNLVYSHHAFHIIQLKDFLRGHFKRLLVWKSICCDRLLAMQSGVTPQANTT